MDKKSKKFASQGKYTTQEAEEMEDDIDDEIEDEVEKMAREKKRKEQEAEDDDDAYDYMDDSLNLNVKSPK